MYILSQNAPDLVQVLDSQFKPSDNFPTFSERTQNCEFDMCLVPEAHLGVQNQQDLPNLSNHSVVLCKRGPPGFVRKVNSQTGQMWQTDTISHPSLTTKFEPCSVSASDDGDIFVADRGTDTVSDPCS